MSSENFSVLPPHFGSDESKFLDRERWQVIAPGYDQYPESFQSCLRYLLESVAHHSDWIMKKDEEGNGVHIPNSHPFVQSRNFTNGDLLALNDKVLPLDCSGRCVDTKMAATGIPPQIDLARQISTLR
jgi:hypothetical protein